MLTAGEKPKFFWRFQFRLYLCTSSLRSLIKKGRGKWPCEALATSHRLRGEQGATSILVNTGKDKPSTQFTLRFCTIKRNSPGYQVSFFVLWQSHNNNWLPPVLLTFFDKY
jgi:hypothetical protein